VRRDDVPGKSGPLQFSINVSGRARMPKQWEKTPFDGFLRKETKKSYFPKQNFATAVGTPRLSESGAERGCDLTAWKPPIRTESARNKIIISENKNILLFLKKKKQKGFCFLARVNQISAGPEPRCVFKTLAFYRPR
jgi:hypothetical protein